MNAGYIAKQRFPRFHAAVQFAATKMGRHFTSEQFAKDLKKFDLDQVRAAEHALAAMTDDQKTELMRRLGFV